MSSDPGSDADGGIVVTVHAEALVETVSAAAERAGQGAHVIVVCCPQAERAAAVLAETRARGGRGIPVLDIVAGVDGAPSLTPCALALLTDPGLRDLDVAVPTFDDDRTRRLLWDQLRAAQIEKRHQLVEVDGRTAAHADLPGLAAAADFPDLAAAAAGILAGRMAAANRTWSRLKP